MILFDHILITERDRVYLADNLVDTLDLFLPHSMAARDTACEEQQCIINYIVYGKSKVPFKAIAKSDRSFSTSVRGFQVMLREAEVRLAEESARCNAGWHCFPRSLDQVPCTQPSSAACNTLSSNGQQVSRNED